jgi:hypothetical protein
VIGRWGRLNRGRRFLQSNVMRTCIFAPLFQKFPGDDVRNIDFGLLAQLWDSYQKGSIRPRKIKPVALFDVIERQ